MADILIKLVVAVLFGGLVGLERQRRGQYAGFRTQLLVCLGACLFTILSIEFSRAYGQPSDPARIAAQVVTGIGFLGAGAILRHDTFIRGLTTAATLWAVSAIGMAIGFGAFWIAGAATLLVMINLMVFKDLEGIFPYDHYARLSVRIKGAEALDAKGLYAGRELKIRQTRVKFKKEDAVIEQEFNIRYRDYKKLMEFVKRVGEIETVVELQVT